MDRQNRIVAIQNYYTILSPFWLVKMELQISLVVLKVRNTLQISVMWIPSTFFPSKPDCHKNVILTGQNETADIILHIHNIILTSHNAILDILHVIMDIRFKILKCWHVTQP